MELVKKSSELYEIQALGGADMSREMVEIVAEVRGGKVYNAEWGDRIKITSETTPLTGWGRLDGEAYIVQTDSASHDLSIPVAAVKELEAKSGQSIELI